MESLARKAAILAWKERKPVRGVFAIHCTATGQTWIGASPTLDKAENRIRFALKHGSQRPASLQVAWRQHGADAFTFAALEQIDEEDIAFSARKTLEERRDAWVVKLGATAI